MFNRKTVFIVGAGASSEVHLPLGNELNNIIAKKTNFKSEGFELTYGDKLLLDVIRKKYDNNNSDYSKCVTASRSISSALHQSISIDNYLHAHADDEHLIFSGKIAIAASILESERKSSMRLDPLGGTDLLKTENTWYNTLFKMLHQDRQKKDIEKIFNNIAFISFNYDRCIEHYLSGAVANYYRIDLDEARKLTSNNLLIEHPYGQVGHLPWSEVSGIKIPFGHRFNSSEILSIVPHIRTFTERIESEFTLSRIHELLKWAEAVVYLGFSYGDMNLQLLTTDRCQAKIIFGTSIGISQPNIRIIKDDIANSFQKTNIRDIILESSECNKFLLDHWRPILRG